AIVQDMCACSDDVIVARHDPGDRLPQDRDVLASLRHVQMNAIREMPPHEASCQPFLEGDAVHCFIERPGESIEIDPFACREVPGERPLNGLASGLGNV